MKDKLQRVLFTYCGRPGRAFSAAVVLNTLGGLLALLVHWWQLGTWVPALRDTFWAYWAMTFALQAFVVWLAMHTTLPTALSRFVLTPGLRPGVPELHLVGSGAALLRRRALIEDLSAAVGVLDHNGVRAVMLRSVLLGDDSFKALMAARLQHELAQAGLAWRVVDAGVSKNLVFDLAYWLKYVAYPKARCALGFNDIEPLVLQRFKRGQDKLMTWGVLSLERR